MNIMRRKRFRTKSGNDAVTRANKKYWSTKKGKACQAKAHEKYRKNNMEKRRAKGAVYRAMKRGTLANIGTNKCKMCQRWAKHYHHHKGYDPKFQLSVTPLCTFCHKKVHVIAVDC